nr:ribonuclease H [uncultured Carboxylicivirga sp.]
MKPIKIIVCIQALTDNTIAGCVNDEQYNVIFNYHLINKKLTLLNENQLKVTLRNFQFQFEKVLLSASKRSLRKGQQIKCVFIDGFNFLNEEAYNNLITLDMRLNETRIFSTINPCLKITRLYTDGSYNPETQTAGFGGMIELENGEKQIFHRSFSGGGSNLMELQAVLEGLKQLQHLDKIQINTDSRYVIRGIAQWMHFWKHNEWQTAYGTPVKSADYWQQLYAICEGKYIELNWIKGHFGHIQQDFVHKLAKLNTQNPTKA